MSQHAALAHSSLHDDSSLITTICQLGVVSVLCAFLDKISLYVEFHFSSLELEKQSYCCI